MTRPAFVPCTYAGKPAVLDTRTRVFYTCATHTRAHDNYLSFRTIKAAIAYGEKQFGETAIRYRR